MLDCIAAAAIFAVVLLLHKLCGLQIAKNWNKKKIMKTLQKKKYVQIYAKNIKY